MAWSDAARAAALAARRAHAHRKVQRSARAKTTYKPSNSAKQAIAARGEAHVRSLLGVNKRKGTSGTNPVDLAFKRGGRAHGVEVKTLIDNKNNKITMHPSSRHRKIAWAAAHHARLHTVVVDSRAGNRVYYRAGVGSFRFNALMPVSSAAHLRRLIGGG